MSRSPAEHVPLSLESSHHELVCLSGAENHSLLNFIAADLFSTFLRDLAVNNPTAFEKKFRAGRDGRGWRVGLKEIAKYLTDDNVCSTEEDARLAIIPAFLASGIKLTDETVSENKDVQ